MTTSLDAKSSLTRLWTLSKCHHHHLVSSHERCTLCPWSSCKDWAQGTFLAGYFPDYHRHSLGVCLVHRTDVYGVCAVISTVAGALASELRNVFMLTPCRHENLMNTRVLWVGFNSSRMCSSSLQLSNSDE